jgi:hypothetical protein
VYRNQSDYRQLINNNFYFNVNNILQDINIMSTSPSFCRMCDNRLQCSLIFNTYDGNFWYSAMGIVVWLRDSFPELWYSMHSVQSPSSQSRHQTSDDLEIWQLSHILQKDGEVPYVSTVYYKRALVNTGLIGKPFWF